MIDPRDRITGSSAVVPESRSGPDRPTRSGAKKRKFYRIDTSVTSRATGFALLNGDKLVERGGSASYLPWVPISDFLERPVFLADAKRGRIHRDFEILSGVWFISAKMKSVLEAVDPEAFALVECTVRSPDGTRQPARWLCNVVRVLDALDETLSTVTVGVADDGSKYYRLNASEKLVFDESVVGGAHVFRIKYSKYRIVCDEELKRACKSADLKGISFADLSK